ncbi:MAG: hypothetical protein NVSMB3_10130 [Acidobacteriaceae bacterium]
MGALSAGAAVTRSSLLGAMAPEGEARPVKRVLLVTKCHLDVGFTMTQAKVMRRYFDVYYPAAMKTAADLRRAGGDRYVWTTGSWLLYEYLEQASTAQRREMEEAVAAGDITWHALPFSWQTEMLDRSMIEGALGISERMDARFGHKTIGAKMTDVPGHSRGMIAPLAEHGVRLLDIGVNAASTPPEVPEVFLWKDSGGRSLAMIYHRHDYGSVLQIPGTEVAVDVEVRNDNSGPHTTAEIAAMYAKLRARFPGAVIEASTLSEVAAVVDTVRESLPVVTGEIGDTWIYGIPSDPEKVARYREMARLRSGWVRSGRIKAGDDTDCQMLRRLLLAVEHTWGTDTKSYLDNNHYRPKDLAAVLGEPAYQVMQVSWQEKRDDIGAGIATLPAGLRKEAESRLEGLRATAPATAGMRRQEVGQVVETAHYTIGLDAQTGAIVRLRSRATGREWASAERPLALFTYQTLSPAEYAEFLERYIKSKEDWAPRDFGKPGIERFGAVSKEWHPVVEECWRSQGGGEDRLVLKMAIRDSGAEAGGNVAWPREMWMEMRMPKAEARVDLRLVTMGKEANRMPEAMWLSFDPETKGERGWRLEKVGERIDPAEVVRGGGRAMHAVADGFRFTDAKGKSFEVRTPDAPVVATGGRSPINFSLEQPTMAGGVHVCLFNNAWGTNYPQWSGGDWAYRITLRG